MKLINQIQWDTAMSKLKMHTKEEIVMWKITDQNGEYHGRI